MPTVETDVTTTTGESGRNSSRFAEDNRGGKSHNNDPSRAT